MKRLLKRTSIVFFVLFLASSFSFAAKKDESKKDAGTGFKLTTSKKDPVKVKKATEVVGGKLDKEPVIDGLLEDVWEKAAKIERFTVVKTALNPKYKTIAYVGYDDNNLYVAFNSNEPDMAGIIANVKENGAGVIADDCVELYLDTRRDHLNYVHFAVNSLGARFTERGSEPGKSGGRLRDKAWAPVWEVKTQKAADSWTVEMKIPLKELGLGMYTTSEWGFNLVRRRQQHGKEFPEYACLTYAQKFFNFPSSYNTLTVDYDIPKYIKEEYKKLSNEIKANSGKIESGFSKAGASNPVAITALKQLKVIRGKIFDLDKKTADIDYSRGKREKFISDFKQYYTSFTDFFVDLDKSEVVSAMARTTGSLSPKLGVAVLDPGKKVIIGENLCPFVTKKTSLSLAKNEYEGFQIVLIPLWTEFSDITISPSDLKSAATGTVIDKANISFSFLGAVKTKPTGSGADYFGWNYDVLLPGSNVPLRYLLQPLWVSVYAPKDAKAGVYAGALKILGGGIEVGKIDLTVEVFDFAVPDEPSLKTAFYFNAESVNTFYGSKPPTTETAAIAETLAKHRLTKVGSDYVYPEGEEAFIRFCKSKGLRTLKIGDSQFPVTNNEDVSTPGFTLDHQYVDVRIMLWFMYKANFKDTLFYPAVTWAPNTSMREKFDPMVKVQMALWDTFTIDRKNGEGNLIYPKGLSSMRLEYIRDGLEDYEYFKLLKDLIQSKRAKLSALDIKAAEALLDFSSIISGENVYTEDMKVLNARKAEIAKMIVSLQAK